MGNCCLPIRFPTRSSPVNPKNVTLLLVGLDNSGKTTIVKRLTGEPLDTVVPTVGFSMVSLQQKGCQVSIYDLGGGPQIRDIWYRYYADAHGVIFVVDANDAQRMDECRKILEDLLRNEHISGKPILLLANKQDLDGALDEIDIVDRLNVERLVNEQKCPTLVELCSARHFSKKLDIGIDNGYKWLIRCIIKDYPALNNRVLMDLARQEEEDRVHLAKREERVKKLREERGETNEIHAYANDKTVGNPFRPIHHILEEKPYQNGIAKHIESMDRFQKTMANIPGLIEDIPDDSPCKSRSTRNLLEEERGSTSKNSRHIGSFSSQFLANEQSESNDELLKNVGTSPEKRNFLIRPKSSGAKLYNSKSDSDIKRAKKRKKLKKSNKTGPSPFTDLSKEQNGPIPKVFDPAYQTEVTVLGEPSRFEENHPDEFGDYQKKNPFIVTSSTSFSQVRRKSEEASVMKVFGVEVKPASKSTPSSRKSSANVLQLRSDKTLTRFSKFDKLPPLHVNNSASSTSEVLLDVTRLESK